MEFYLGRADANGQIVEVQAQPMEAVEKDDNVWIFRAVSAMNLGSGLYGFTVRVIPDHPDSVTPYLPGLILWAGATVSMT